MLAHLYPWQNHNRKTVLVSSSSPNGRWIVDTHSCEVLASIDYHASLSIEEATDESKARYKPPVFLLPDFIGSIAPRHRPVEFPAVSGSERAGIRQGRCGDVVRPHVEIRRAF
jgi:hypothetical protein